ncbi:MAG: zinc ABC transporter substrate-binding protein [Elusimicrobia bacterium]|nr:zinc ABC transporter substrate-binding protein [Elusimicrobiota bacterium]
MKFLNLFALTSLFCAAPLAAKVKVVTTTEDLAALAAEVAGDSAEVTAIARGYQDPHFVEAKPSYLLKLKKAQLFIQVGLELETGWAPALLSSARNPGILPGRPGFMDASEGCEILGKPTGGVDRSLGDVHPLGNPHYWLNPENGRVIARAIAHRLSVMDPDNSGKYKANLAAFEERLSEKEKEWDASAAAFKGVKVVTYHNSWPSFARRFGLEVVDFVEPRPGIPPSPAHIHSLITRIRASGVRLLLVEPYFDLKLPEKVAAESGAALVVIPPSVGGEAGIKTYSGLFDRQLELLKNALGGK